MIFNKKGLFRGGLYLVNTAVIALSTSRVVVAEEECSVTNKQNQIYWRLYANNEILKAEGESEEQSKWITNKKYRDSIINVIGKAIGDCMAKENEFKGNNREDIGNKVILFEGKDSEGQDKYKDPYDYTIKNWNAVYLYNAVNLAINNDRYWNPYKEDSKELNSENLLSECHKLITNHFYGVFKTSKNNKELTQKLEEVNTEGKQIIENLAKMCETKVKLLKKLKTNKKNTSEEYELKNIATSIDIAEKELNDIRELQKALEDFNKDEGDMKTLYQEAMNKVNQARTYRKHTAEYNGGTLILSSQEVALNDETAVHIRAYLKSRRNLIVRKELPQKLEKAKSNILKYFQALNLDEILRDVYRYYSQHKPFSPAKKTKETVRIVDHEPAYEIFRYNILMDLEVKPTSYYLRNNRLFDEIGYKPNFFIRSYNKRTDRGQICISGVFILQQTIANYETKNIDSYGWANEDKYEDLLELLQGLVVPMKKYYNPKYL